MKNRLTQIACLTAAIFLCGAVLAEIFLYSQNTLLGNGNWRATKRDLQMSIVGADEFLVTRSTISGNTLDLGKWYGYQEVLLKDSTGATEIQFSFRIPENSYLDVLFDKGRDKYSGVRLSRATSYPSIYFLSNAEGRFLSTEQLLLERIGSEWHQALLKIYPNSITLQINQGPVTVLPAINGPMAFGLRGGFTGALIDDVTVKYANGEILVDSFRNERGWLRYTTLYSACLAVIFGLAFFLLRKKSRRQGAEILNGGIIIAAQLFICLSIYHGFDLYYWSKLPFQTNMRLLSTGEAVPQIPFERYRANFFRGWNRLMSNENYLQADILKEYVSARIFRGPVFCGGEGTACVQASTYVPASRGKGCLRFALIGTSQSIGAGAVDLERSFFVRIHRGLSKNVKDRCVESLNLSISASNLEELTAEFNEHIAFAPDVVAVNLSNNDTEPGFYEMLRNFVKINQKIHSRILFVLEANSADVKYDFGLKNKHETMRKVGAEFGLETFSMHDYLASGEVMRSGQLWWDFVHLSSFGQELMAEQLEPKLLALLKSRSSRP